VNQCGYTTRGNKSPTIIKIKHYRNKSIYEKCNL